MEGWRHSIEVSKKHRRCALSIWKHLTYPSEVKNHNSTTAKHSCQATQKWMDLGRVTEPSPTRRRGRFLFPIVKRGLLKRAKWSQPNKPGGQKGERRRSWWKANFYAEEKAEHWGVWGLWNNGGDSQSRPIHLLSHEQPYTGIIKTKLCKCVLFVSLRYLGFK